MKTVLEKLFDLYFLLLYIYTIALSPLASLPLLLFINGVTTALTHLQPSRIIITVLQGIRTCSKLKHDYSTINLNLKRLKKQVKFAAEKQAPLQKPPDSSANLSSDEIKPLSGNPFFHVVLSKSHVHRSCLMGPSKDLVDILPSVQVPTVLKCKGKSWDMAYRGHAPGRKFFDGGWRKFAIDNHLGEGDACVFELMENSDEKIIFQVQILKGDLPEV
ncbi:hypothetical protein PIB30_092675 [Stylosanthes scabra]|uniref:TF-B3 domain-containing protein n=1 Tax=Stylosanthes scabra TaxID=79078 RepID=A0ABU6TWV4_9FABA|nr:hypothetical protein [Stylosanthes scabra]